MDIKLRGRSRDNGNDLFYHNAIAEIYHNVKDGCLMGFAGYDPDTKKPILLDIELFTGFYDGEGNELWEHDTVKYPAAGEANIFTIVWDQEKGCWSLENDSSFFPMAPIVQDLMYVARREKMDTSSSKIYKENQAEEEKPDKVPYTEIIAKMNEVLGTNYRPVESNNKYIRARWNEGFRQEDFVKVCLNKKAKWGDDPKMAQYLRPATLFGSKFDSYLNEVQPETQCTTPVWL